MTKCPGLSRRFLVNSALSGLAIGPMFSGGARATEALDVRLARHPDKTRFVVDLSDDLPYSYFTLTDPYRLVIDLPAIEWRGGSAPAGESAGVVKAYRYGLFKPGTSRIVLDLSGPAEVQRAFKLTKTGATPWRLVFDLSPTSHASFLRAEGPANRAGDFRPGQNYTETRTAKAPEVSDPMDDVQHVYPDRKPAVANPRRKPVIVLDPGHGGVDPGAIGISGVYEKNITLAAAREFKAHLEATGNYKVILTRSRDVSLKLRQRKEIARRANADLFISMHADSIGNKSVKGLSVYTLSETASDREAALLAERENKADMIIGVDLSNEPDHEYFGHRGRPVHPRAGPRGPAAAQYAPLRRVCRAESGGRAVHFG